MSDKSLQKLVIRSFKEKDFKEEDTDRLFTAPINPESFTKNYKVELDTRRGHGQPGTGPGYKSTAPEELKLEFILDGTATMFGYVNPKMSVTNQLEKFLKCVYDFDGEIHRPRFLIVHWGSQVKFPCVLSNLDINHTLFDSDGEPLRVKITATFFNYQTDESRAAVERLQSPDLTHRRIVRQADRLDLMTHKIYKSPSYFLQVARINGLSTVRQIRAGTELYFPPFDKNES